MDIHTVAHIAQIMTNAEFREWVNLPENDGKRFELHEGVTYEMPSPSPLHSYVVGVLVQVLLNFVRPRNLGYVFADNLDFTLAPGIVYQPDVSFISLARSPNLNEAYKVAPELAVEILSPSNTSKEITQKVENYLRYGSLLVWVVSIEERAVRVYRAGNDGSVTYRRYGEADMLDGGDVLPGFTLQVREMFPSAAAA